MNRNYFKNLKAEDGAEISVTSLELIIPEGFNSHLNSIEIMQLLNDQLLQFGLQTRAPIICGTCYIGEASKRAKPIEQISVSKRLQYYLKLFHEVR